MSDEQCNRICHELGRLAKILEAINGAVQCLPGQLEAINAEPLDAEPTCARPRPAPPDWDDYDSAGFGADIRRHSP